MPIFKLYFWRNIKRNKGNVVTFVELVVKAD